MQIQVECHDSFHSGYESREQLLSLASTADEQGVGFLVGFFVLFSFVQFFLYAGLIRMLLFCQWHSLMKYWLYQYRFIPGI